jgi:ferredoxin
MINKLFRSKYYPIVFQIAALIVFISLISGALGVSTNNATILKQLRNTNLSNLIVWSYWWPLIVLTAVIFGRHWCSICPIELISFVFEKIGFKKKAPGWLKSGWIIPILYAFIAIVAIHTWGIHRSPSRMAYYLLFLMGLAALISLVFKNRAFCSSICPVGKLLSLYSLLAKWGIRVRRQDVCTSCKTKDCVKHEKQYKLVKRSCNSGLYPANIKDNRDCILCTQCIKSCSKNNIALKKDSIFNIKPEDIRWPEVGMLVILLGFICYENMSSWPYTDQLLRFIPKQIYSLSGFDFISYNLFEGLVIFFILPFAILSLLSMLVKASSSGSFWETLRKLCTVLLPLIAFGHLFKALLKTSSRLPYWKYALNDPNGLFYAQKIADKTIQLQSMDCVNLSVIIVGIAGLLYASMLAIKFVDQDQSSSLFNKCMYLAIIFAHLFLLLSGPISSFLQ